MFFTRTHTFQFPLGKDDVTNRLLGKHVKIHNLDFEVIEHEGKLMIIPHAEEVTEIKTLPITSVTLTGEGNKTKAVIKSKMRPLDSGGPFLIMIFCMFMFIASIILLLVENNDRIIAYTLFGMSVGIFSIFWFRLEIGYFDYVRKIRAYVKNKANPSAAGAAMPMAQA